MIPISLEGMMLKLKLQYFGHSCEELTHWKRLWCWEGLGEGGEGDDREWNGWMASPTQWTWVWIESGSWWWTERPDVLQFMGLQRVGHDWATELNWTESCISVIRKDACCDFSFLNLARLDLWPEMWSIPESVSCALGKKKMYPAVWWWNMLKISKGPSSLACDLRLMFLYSFSLWMICPLV